MGIKTFLAVSLGDRPDAAINEADTKFGLWTLDDTPEGGKGKEIVSHATTIHQKADGGWAYAISVIHK